VGLRGARLRERCAPGRPLWVAGSTHPGEEEECLAAQRELLRRAAAAGLPPPLLVLAPRRPERFEAVAEALASQSLRTLRWSQRAAQAGPLPQADVLLLDVLGELLVFYAAADFAFVGGSLVPVGGHNLLEPAALGRVTLTGPHTQNSPEAAALLEAANALTRVADGEGLASALWQFLQQPQLAAAQGARAAAAVAANRGAARRCLLALEPLVPQLGRTRRP
jgi:3-deoxy-D-manno-octulosonic-acid transferase